MRTRTPSKRSSIRTADPPTRTSILSLVNITFLDSSTLTRGDIDFASLEALGTFTHHEHTKPAEVIDRCRDVEVILTNKVVLDAGTIGSLPSLQLILVCATGVNVVDLEAARERDIPVCNVAGYSTPSVAQHTAALLLALATRVHRLAAEHDEWPPVWCRQPRNGG